VSPKSSHEFLPVMAQSVTLLSLHITRRFTKERILPFQRIDFATFLNLKKIQVSSEDAGRFTHLLIW
jgi:hypothetical protein